MLKPPNDNDTMHVIDISSTSNARTTKDIDTMHVIDRPSTSAASTHNSDNTEFTYFDNVVGTTLFRLGVI